MNEQTLNLKDRIISIDALRGLAMFSILALDIGGALIFETFSKLWGESFANAAANQLRGGFVEGLRLCFVPMPMFLFIVGLVIPFSMSKRLPQQQNSKKNIYLHIIKRGLILFFLGLIPGGPLLNLEFAKMPVYDNVLEFIGIGYIVCAIIVLNRTWTFQLVLTLVLMVLYYLVFLIIPVPGWDGEIFSGKMNLAIYIDNVVLGPHHNPGSWEVLATISFIANMLLGVLMGQLLNSTRDKKYKLKMLFVFGLAMLVAGMIWGLFFPVIRSLWTSSFVLETCGITTLLLAVFYWLIDIRGYKKWAFFFIVFGVNSIAIYMMAHLFDFKLIGNIIIGGFSNLFPSNVKDFIQAVGAMTVMWLIMYWMYLKKTFIKI
jgi:predicted acyltransferase